MRKEQIPCSRGGAELQSSQQKASFTNARFRKAKNDKYVHDLKKVNSIS
jgi:hypothetical protein